MKELFVVGIGPGGHEDMTIRADRILKSCEVIIGYTAYVELVRAEYPKASFLTTPMRREVERCELAFAQAGQGRSTAMICSGDAGVYGMAGLILELGERHPDVRVEIVPGVTAALSGAALLGAPLMHDFCVISLSDLLTPWEKIEERLHAAAAADFSICLYNPASKKRADYLSRAAAVVLRYRSPETVCGVVRQIGREGESRRILTLSQLQSYEADMFTTVFIGNSQTMRVTADGRMQEAEPVSAEMPVCETTQGMQKEKNFMVTPRGYRI